MREISKGNPADPRLTTGVRGLDTVLHGGFLPGNTFLLMGRPGAGKTILANQICSYQAQLGNGAVYVTLLAESHGRLVSNLKRLSFFDESVVSKTLHYISGYHVFEEQGFDGLRQLLHQLVKDKGARILVIDGLNVLEGLPTDRLAFRKFFHELQFLTGLTGCTVLLITNLGVENSTATYTLVDGILQLDSEISLRREKRLLRVLKYRGSDHLHGNHAYEITIDGITVFPRREALRYSDTNLRSDGSRLSLGIPGFDAMLGGGPESKSATFLVGALGTGKSMVGLEFLCSGAARGEPGLYYSFEEAPSRIMQRTGALAARMEEHSKTGRIRFRWQQPLEVVLDSFAEELLDLVANYGTKRVFIDGIEGLTLSALPHERLASFLPVFLNELRDKGITSILSLPTSDLFSYVPNTAFAELLESADNLLLLRNVINDVEIHREAAVLRLRNSDFEARWRRYSISLQGIQVAAGGGGGKP